MFSCLYLKSVVNHISQPRILPTLFLHTRLPINETISMFATFNADRFVTNLSCLISATGTKIVLLGIILYLYYDNGKIFRPPTVLRNYFGYLKDIVASCPVWDAAEFVICLLPCTSTGLHANPIIILF